MKLTREDIRKYGTEDEKKILKEYRTAKYKDARQNNIFLLLLRDEGDNIYGAYSNPEKANEAMEFMKKQEPRHSEYFRILEVPIDSAPDLIF